MSAPSKWPLPKAGIRFITPRFMIDQLASNELARDCYPTAMGYYPAADGHEMRRQRHDDNLLIYCVAGQGEARAGDWMGTISGGQAILLPQGLEHEYRARPGQPWTVYWVHFQGRASAALLQHLGYREDAPRITLGISAPLTAAFDSLMEVRHTGYSTRAFIHAASQLRQLLTQVAVDLDRETGRNAQGLDLEQIQAFMREHLDQSLRLEALARQAKLSKYHFLSRYKALTGYTPIKHFVNMKIERACRLLDATDLSVTDVAATLGYDDPMYFSRQFKKIIGHSPRRYRSSIRIEPGA
ncbi:MAG: AraC family transcriptional regulator [Pseudomonadota bacterium]